MSEEIAASEKHRPPRQPFKWGFARSAGVILALMLVGEAVGRLAGGLWDGEWVGRDFLLLAFFFFAAGWVFLTRAAVVRFFRAMQTGVMLVALSLSAVAVGVLVPQIEGFEDPAQRVTPQNHESQFRQFLWAEGYFFYHLRNLYGIGMPEAQMPPGAVDKLAAFGKKYGFEEEENRRKRMEAAFTGQAKTAEIRELIDANEDSFRRFFDVATALHLNRTYKSSWFATLMLLLGVGIFANTFRGPWRSRLGIRRVGFFVTHLGMLTLLVGGGISNWFTVRGLLELDLRKPPQNRFYMFYRTDKLAEMPFHLGLERFGRQDWKQLQVEFAHAGFSSAAPTYTLWPGRTIDLDFYEDGGVDRPGLRLRVLELFQRAKAGGNRFFELDPAEGGLGPMVHLRRSGRFPEDPEHAPHPGHSADENRFDELIPCLPKIESLRYVFDPAWKFRLAAEHGDEDPELMRGLFPADEPLGKLHMRLTTGGDPEALSRPVHLGDSFDAPGGYRIEIQNAYANFIFDKELGHVDPGTPLAEQLPRNPAVFCRIVSPDGEESEERKVLELIDSESTGLQQRYRFPDLVLGFEWDFWSAPGPPRYFLHWGDAGEAWLVGEDGSLQEALLGMPLGLPGDTRIVPETFSENAGFEQEIEFLAPRPPAEGVDVDFYARDARGLLLEVTRWPGTEREEVHEVRLATNPERLTLSNTWRPPDDSFEILFFENTSMMPFEWRSVLSVWEEDASGRLAKVDAGPERDREIRVNDYFKYKGYRFFQTDANPKFPTYSGIGVVFDPGIPVVLTGMYTIILGTVLAFLVRPIVLARSKRRQAA